MGLFVSTTGTSVAVPELGITIAHPTTDQDIGGQFNPEEIRGALSLTSAIIAGTLVWRKLAAGAIQTAGNYDPDYIDIENENTGTGLQDDRVVTFKDLTTAIATSASPGFTWGRSGSSGSGTWLQNESVPSNKAGRACFLDNAFMKKIFVANEDAAIFTVGIYTHDGNEANLTQIGTVTTLAVRTNSFSVSLAVAKDKQIAIRVESGSAKNIVAGALIAGTL